MDQNVIRTDLLPESMALWIVALLAVFATAAWVACHLALKHYGANKFNIWQRAGMSLPLGTVASWLILQAIAKVLFLATPWSLFTAAIVTAVSVEAISAFYTHECARIPMRTARVLVACRMAAVLVALLVLMQPVLIGERERTVARRVLVLIDDSSSMHFKDQQMTDEEKKDILTALGMKGFPKGGMTRGEMIRSLIDKGGEDSFLNRVSAKYHVDVFRFGNGLEREESLDIERELDAKEATFRSTTDITKALELAIKEVPVEEIASIILFTDGRHNGDAGVESISRKLGSYGVSVSTVLVGGTVKPFDISISTADAPESIFLGDKVRLTVSVRATRANGRRAKIKVSKGKEVLQSEDFLIESDDWVKEFKFTDIPNEKGVYRYVVDVTKIENELFADNNERSLEVAVSDDRTNVLLVDSRPRWEFRYLRNLFYGRDKSVHLQDWIVNPDKIAGVKEEVLPYANAAREFGDSESGGFPFNREMWRAFDVIILGDIGEDILTPEIISELRYCVGERGALLVFIAGSEKMPMSIRHPQLRELIPVLYDPDDVSHIHSPEENYAFTLAAPGRGHAVMSQSSSSAENEEIWQNIPYFHWRLPVKGVKMGAEVLAYAVPKREGDSALDAAVIAQSIAATIEEDPEAAMKRLEEMRSEQARNSLVVASTFGRGKVLMMNTESMWRLRSKDGDHLHHRFWGQVMRWGAGEKLRAGNTFVRIGTDQLRYGAGETVKAYVRITDHKYNAIEGLSPRLVLHSPGGGNKMSAFYPKPRPDSNGFYECEISGCDTPGVYRLSLECPKAQEKLGKRFPVNLNTQFVVVTTKQPAEEVEITATSEFVERMAKATGGMVIKPSEYVGLNEDFGGGSKQVTDRVEYQLWSLPPLFILITLLLTCEWIMRKRANLS